MPRLISGLAAVAVVLAAFAAAPAQAAERLVLGDGHADLAAVLEDDVLRVVWQVGAARHGAHDVVLHVRPQARAVVPDDPALGVLGVPGAAVWVLPQIEQPGVVWPGLSTEQPAVQRRAQGVRLVLRAVRGPGRFVLLSTDGLGPPDVLLDSGRGLPQAVPLAPGTHAHASWAFTAEGAYALDVRLEAQMRDGRRLTADTTVRVAVGARPAAAAFDRLDVSASGGPATGRALAAAGAAATVALILAVVAVLRRRRTR